MEKVVLNRYESENTMLDKPRTEDDITNKFRNAFRAFQKSSLDVPKFDCISCHKLCFKRDVTVIKNMRKPLLNDYWAKLQTYNQENKIEQSPYILSLLLEQV